MKDKNIELVNGLKDEIKLMERLLENKIDNFASEVEVQEIRSLIEKIKKEILGLLH